jgi:hypothetical protein
VIQGCDYRGRGLYLSEGDTCKGCGAPLPHDPRTAPAVMYDPAVFGYVFKQSFIGSPEMNIPITLTKALAVEPIARAWFTAEGKNEHLIPHNEYL